MPGKVWDKITYPFLNFNGATVELSLEMDKYFRPTHYDGCKYLSMLGSKLIHVSKMGHWRLMCALGYTQWKSHGYP